MDTQYIRNFAIIAHVDHGKTTLTDRLLEITGLVDPGKHEDQLLDKNPISRERGITIKLAPVRLQYKDYILNLIDTPGHVDFSYEVDRTLACIEGVVLLVDATQGIQAQTIANAYKALEKNAVIIPVVNKIDLPNAQVDKTCDELVDFLGVSPDDICKISAKSGDGVAKLLETVVTKVPSPQVCEGSLQALIFDSYYDSHRGVIAFCRVYQGTCKQGDNTLLYATQSAFTVNEVGSFQPELMKQNNLQAGEIGYIVTNLKDIHQVQVGDTITTFSRSASAIAGYKKIKPMVYASLFPTDTDDYLNLKKALDKLYLNDAALDYASIYSQALGAGFRVGFLGLLHADVTRERLEREFEMSIVLTPPKVEFEYENNTYKEPITRILIITPNDYVGSVMKLCEEHRGTFITMDNQHQVTLTYELPLAELISDFFDTLKSVTSGYASLDWELIRYDETKADHLTIMINNDPIEEFSETVVQERAQERARDLVSKLKDTIPKQQYEIKIQAKYKGKIIASERLSALRKDVTAKLYGGDRTRKDKLLNKQKEGKKRMKMIGRVEVPKDTFLKIFNTK